MSRFIDSSNDASVLDQDNRTRTERLAAKLARLKNVAVDIEEETRDHIPMLDSVDDSYERTFSAISYSQNRLTRLLRNNKRSRLFCYTVFLILGLLIVLYFWSNHDNHNNDQANQH